MASHVIPKLRLGQEDELGILGFRPIPVAFGLIFDVRADSVVLPPEISESAEAQPIESKEILEPPNKGELERKVAPLLGTVEILALRVIDGFVKSLYVESVLIVRAMDEIIQAEKEGVVDSVAIVGSAIIFHVETERRQTAAFPEIETAGDFEIRAVRGADLAVRVLGSVVIVNEEEGVPPLVAVEAFESGGNVLAVTAEIIENLEVSLGLGAYGAENDDDGQDGFLCHLPLILRPFQPEYIDIDD